MTDDDKLIARIRAQHLEAHRRGRLARLIAYIRSDEPDLTNRQMAVLLLIVLDGPLPLRSIAHTLRVTKPVITRAASSLTRFGLAERIPDPQDGRGVFIAATTEGRAFIERLPI